MIKIIKRPKMHEFYKGIDLIFYNLLKDLIDFTMNPEENHIEAGFDSSDLFVPPDGRETFLSFKVGKWELTKSSDGVFTLCTKDNWTRDEMRGHNAQAIILDDVVFENTQLVMRQNTPPAFQTLAYETFTDRVSRIMRERRDRQTEQALQEAVNLDTTDIISRQRHGEYGG